VRVAESSREVEGVQMRRRQCENFVLRAQTAFNSSPANRPHNDARDERVGKRVRLRRTKFGRSEALARGWHADP
jgi:hypothetical protein